MRVRIGTEYGKTFEFAAEHMTFEDVHGIIRCTASRSNGMEDTYAFISKHISVKIFAKESEPHGEANHGDPDEREIVFSRQ